MSALSYTEYRGKIKVRKQEHKARTYFKHRITNAAAKALNSKIATIQKRACGFRNHDHFKISVYFQCGGLDLYPAHVTHGKV